MTDKLLLTDPAFEPTEDHLALVLGELYVIYPLFHYLLDEAQIGMEWRYYNDSKAWLCKCQYKKKTVLWHAIFEGFFRATFFFTESAYEGMQALPFDEQPKREKNVGKSIPVLMDITSADQMPDLKLLIEYKKGLK